MTPSRAARGVLAAGAAALVVAIATASRDPGPRAWALHLPGFLPDPARSFVMALLVGGAALLAVDFFRGGASGGARGHEREGLDDRGRGRRERPARPAARRAAHKPARGEGLRPPHWTGWLLLLPWVWLLWKLETRTRFLGDGTIWLAGIRSGNPNPFSEPLAAATWAGYSRILRSQGLPIDPVTAGLLPILCGVIAAILFWRIASEIASKTGSRWIALGVLATLGIAQLYFGYIESYPLASVAILAYLWLGLRRARGADHPIWVAAALGIAVPFHLASTVLAPSFLYLLLREKRPWLERAALALVPAVIAGGLLVLMGYPPSRWFGAFHIAARAVESGHGAGDLARPYALFSLDHAWDVLNAIFLAMPVPALLLLTAMAGRAGAGGATERGKAWDDPAAIFLGIAALPGFLLAAALVLPVPPAQDWDLRGTLLIPLAVLGIKLGFSIPKLPMHGARGAGLALLGAGTLLSFVLVNANEEAGVHRFETLIGPGARITAYGRAYGNELLAAYDVDRKDYARAAVHAQRALEAEPTNPRYWIKKGAALYELGRYDEAIPILEEGIRRGPARDDGYYDLGNCLARKRRYPEAVANYREAIRLGNARPDYLNNLGVALYYSGDTDSARVLWTEVVQRWPWYTLGRRSLLKHFGSGAADSAAVTSARG